MNYKYSVVLHISKYMDELDRLCNHDCSFCIERMEPNRSQEIVPNLDDVKIELSEYLDTKERIDTIFVAGGEPTMNPHFKEIVQYIRTICDDIILSTNCDYEFPDETIDIIMNLGIKKISTSVHGSCDSVHDELTGSYGSFERTIKIIKKLIANDISVSINSVICSKNINDMPNILQLFKNDIPKISKLVFTHFANHGNAYYYKELLFNCENYRAIIEKTVDRISDTSFTVKFRDFPICIDYRLADLQEDVRDISVAHKEGAKYSFLSEKAPFFEKEKCKKCRYEELCPKFLVSNYYEV